MPGLWHWKHLFISVSLPGASGNPGACGFGFCCANAVLDRQRKTIGVRARIAILEMRKIGSVLFSVDADGCVLDELADLHHLAPYHRTEFLRRSGRDFESEPR